VLQAHRPQPVVPDFQTGHPFPDLFNVAGEIVADTAREFPLRQGPHFVAANFPQSIAFATALRTRTNI
jgi:hypothetical protein